ncbi:hypothetical protein WN53_08380 [Serratia fonticola]|uniref:hypothetical protein n=1 Tax=Serratia fonticola TaxID=47917 RepID=UPI00041FE2ED|nr:hypothetical protein [Serratia fonticola]AKG69147.1 hypothetical protein WN53_08380 [Serratia fonticola]CAI1791441.1 Uncharacterised protein [Serratia fonticola]
MNNHNTLISNKLDSHVAHLILSTSKNAENAPTNTRWLTEDYDRLTGPIFLLNLIARADAKALLKIYRRLQLLMNTWKGLRIFPPTLSRLAELAAQAEQSIPVDSDVDSELLQSMATISDSLRSDEHKRRVAEWLWAKDRNLRIGLAAQSVINTSYPSFVAVGVELAYADADTPLERVVQDRQQLLSELRNILEFEHCAGAYWYLDYGQQKGYYLHSTFFFPTEEPRIGPILAKRIGEHWQTTVTKGDGCYHANTHVQTEYQYPGCLFVQQGDSDMLKQLEWWLICMTCVDEFFPLALPEGQHAFDTQAYVYYLRSQSDWTETSLYEAEMMNEWVEKLRKKA